MQWTYFTLFTQLIDQFLITKMVDFTNLFKKQTNSDSIL